MGLVRTESTLLSPMIDVVFKMLLTRSGSGRLLRDLSNTMLRPKEPFEDLQVLNPGIDLETITHKAVVLDVLATTRTGEQVQIEMQASSQGFFRERALYYAARLYGSQLARGEDYEELRATYALNFLNFDLFPCQNPDQFVQTFRMREDRTGESLSGHLEVHFVELLKFSRLLMKSPHGSGDEHLDHWLQFLLNPSDKRLEGIGRTDPIIGEAMDQLKEISSDEQARQLARMREVGERDYRSGMKSAHKQGLEEGLAKGLEEGIAKGLEEGIAKGLEEGRAEGEAQAKIALLKSLLASPVTAALPNEALAELVQLPIEQVAAMRANQPK
jgi:predicted transposase/invertase (TIGR01784 family)